MANGFQGLGIIVRNSPVSTSFGMQGLGLAIKNQQYLQPLRGVTGIGIQLKINDKPIKIIRK